MTHSGDWISDRSDEERAATRARVKDYTETQAQERMYFNKELRDRLNAMADEIERQNIVLLEEARAMLENFPTLRFKRPK